MVTQNDVKSQNMDVCANTKVYRVEILQGWCTARSAHEDSDYDVTKATYWLPDLYRPKMKNPLFIAPESNGLSCACAV